MPKRVEENAYIYNYKRLNFIFSLSSFILLICIGLMVFYDYNREWKKYQREFIAKTKKQLEELKKIHKSAIEDDIKKINEQILKAKQLLDEKKEEIIKLEKEIKDIDGKYYLVNQQFEFVKAKLNYLRWQIEQNLTIEKQAEIDKKNKLYQKLVERQNKLFVELQSLGFEKKQKEQKLSLYKIDLEKLMAEKEKIEKRVKDLDKQLKDFEETFQNTFRNLPIVDFISPTISVDKYQKVLPNLQEDYHFVKVPKVDRCMVCHLTIDKPGFENAPQPFTTHPKLELFVADTSYHPVNKFGCTVCHYGSGRATTFIGASHTPKNDEQQKEWIRKYNWHENHYWDYPMLPSQYTESSCLKCHNHQTLVPFADKLNKGKMILMNSGCFGCHKIEGFENVREIGPTLINISTKLSGKWMEEWIKNPRKMNIHTKMPQSFFLSNTSDEDDKKINDIFIKGIVAYLLDNSSPTTLSSIPQNIEPNIEEGKKLFNLKGCIACHTVGQNYERDNTRKFGPDLSDIGSKLSGENGLKWLYNWIKNPHGIFPNTKMPDMRLEDKEILQIAVYLQSLTIDNEIRGVEEIDTKKLHELTEYYLLKNYNINEIENIQNVLDIELLKIRKDVLEDYLDSSAYSGLPNELKKKVIEVLKKIKLDDIENFTNEEFNKLKEEYKKFEQDIENIRRMIIEKVSAIKIFNEETKKLLYIGYKGILRQGCFGCHQILGFSKVPKIGIELTGSEAIGSKDVEKFDFGYINIPKTRWAWLIEKLKNPRVFDKGKILHYDDKLRMPHFNFTVNEIENLVTYILGFTNEAINFDMKKNLSYKEMIIEKGKQVALSKNCVSCHQFTKDMVILHNPRDNSYAVLEGIVRQYDVNKKVFSFTNLTENSKYELNIVKIGKDFSHIKNIFAGLGAFAKEDMLSEEAKARGVEENRKNELLPFLPPILYNQGFKVQRKWLYDFLPKPFTLRPWLNVVMPKFIFTKDELNELIGFFSFYSNVDTLYEDYPFLDKKYIMDKISADKEYLNKAREIFNKLECVKCHIVGKKNPEGSPENWAPDLLIAKKRLNPEWMIKWIYDPQRLQPQTKMPTFFENGKPNEIIKDAFDGNVQKQIEALVDYILHGLKEE